MLLCYMQLIYEVLQILAKGYIAVTVVQERSGGIQKQMKK